MVGALVALGGGLTLWFSLAGGSDDETPGVVRTSGPLPQLSGVTLDGHHFMPVVYRPQVLVVNFWNPYCTPCRAEAAVLDVAHGALAHLPVTMVGVLYSNANFPHDLPAARRFVRELGEQYPTIDDPEHRIAQSFDVRGIPTTVIADRSGKLRFAVLGALKPGQVERLVRRVLRG